MKNKSLKFIICSVLLMIVSCNEPETIVTNYIHRDGSVTRIIEMRSIENKFSNSDVQLPFDSAWTVTDSVEMDDFENDGKPDTVWVKKVERTFSSIDEINQLYRNDSSCNRKYGRSVSLEKKFRWFNTGIRFSEKIEKVMEFGYPVDNYLNHEELTFFYSPDFQAEELKDGPDSLKIRALLKTIEKKTDQWIISSAIAEWIGQFGKLTSGSGTGEMIKDLHSREPEIYDLISGKYADTFDSLWKAGVVQEDILGEEAATKFRIEADSAMSVASEAIFSDLKDYSVRIVMPGSLTGTNGYVDSTGKLNWPVSQEYFLTRPYEMWAESKVTNIWAWLVSGAFLLFVFTGIIIKSIKKAE